MTEHGITSLLNVPIALDGIVWGVLEVDSDTPPSLRAERYYLFADDGQHPRLVFA
jgi:hypothetical protein